MRSCNLHSTEYTCSGILDIIIISFYANLILCGGSGGGGYIFFSAVKPIGFMGFTINASLLHADTDTCTHTHTRTVYLSIHPSLSICLYLYLS